MAASAQSQQRRGKKGKRGAVDQEAVSANITKTMTAMRGAATRGRGGRRFGSDMRAEMEEQRVAAVEKERKTVRVNEFITVSELSKILGVSATQIVGFAFKITHGRFGQLTYMRVYRGTLKRGDIVVAGSNFGRVRALLNERDEQLTEAGPSTPVEILGLDGTPDPGEPFAVVENEARARELTEYRTRVKREKAGAPVAAGATLADMMAKLQDKKVSELPVIIKADVQGSAEAIVQAEPAIAGFVLSAILHQPSLEAAVIHRVASRPNGGFIHTRPCHKQDRPSSSTVK